MQYQANADSYLETEVFTAPPQKLQLMLLDAAIRQIARVKQQWGDGEEGKAALSLIHAQQIVEQLIAGVNREAAPELADRALGVYSFLARRLMEAGANRDSAKLDDATRVLEIDRETWRRVCEELSGKSADESNYISTADEIRTPLPTFDSLGDIPTSGLSLEA